MDKDVNLIVVCGATATGKSKLAVQLAKQLDTEIISADSMQIYKNLDIGTAKIQTEEMQGIKHHLIDIKNPDEPFSVADFLSLSKPIINTIQNKGKIPIVCGGTGLYISSLIDGIAFKKELDDFDEKREAELHFRMKSKEENYKMLCEIDPEYAKNVHPNNEVRVIRALALFAQTGTTMSSQIRESKPTERLFNERVLNLCYAKRELLNERIESRIDQMVNNGLVPEAEYVFKNKASFKTAISAIGYKEFFPYFEQKTILDDAIMQLKAASKKYAKRQMTWFRRIQQKTDIMVDDGIGNISLDI